MRTRLTLEPQPEEPAADGGQAARAEHEPSMASDVSKPETRMRLQNELLHFFNQCLSKISTSSLNVVYAELPFFSPVTYHPCEMAAKVKYSLKTSG